MKEQLQRMLDGEPYRGIDDERLQSRIKQCTDRLRRFNTTGEGLDEIFGAKGDRITLVAPFNCDFGIHITLGDDVFINCGCVFLDCATIKIGSHTFFGPGVKLCTATHPTHYLDRREWEIAQPIVIEDDVWLGAGVIVCPGVTIGARSIAAAGSVVTRSVPPDSLVAGNPAVVKKRLNVGSPLGFER